MGDAVELRLDGVVHFLIGMAQAIDRGSAGAVDILLARRVVEVAALAISDLGQVAGLPGRGEFLGGLGLDGGHGHSFTRRSGDQAIAVSKPRATASAYPSTKPAPRGRGPVCR